MVAYANKQGGPRSSPAWLECLDLFQLPQDNVWSIRARHIPGHLNVIADQLSRPGQILPTEWSLLPQLLRLITDHWDRPQVDLFATRYNNKLQLFVSPVPDPLALEVDALSIGWEGMDAYAFPPHVILSSVLAKFERTKTCRLILVAPLLPTFSWLPALKRLATGLPLKLPVSARMLKQPQSDRFHLTPESLNLHAWLLQKPH